MKTRIQRREDREEIENKQDRENNENRETKEVPKHKESRKQFMPQWLAPKTKFCGTTRAAVLFPIGVMVIFYFSPVFAQSTKLTQAAQNTSNLVTTLAQMTSGIGILAGGVLMSLGQAQIGRTVLGGGILGAILSFAGPAILGAIREIFR